MKTPFRSPVLGRMALLAAAGLLAAGCSSNSNKADRPENPFKTATAGPSGKAPLSDRELRMQADQLYRRARNALENSDYTTAISRYDTLIARYPFSDYSTQAELEKIYAQYKSYQPDDATSAADRFLRAHPRHPHADYVQYIKGLADFERDDTILDSITPGSAKRDVGNQLRSFEDFALLLQRYPNSRYYGDARRRMLYSRNRIASHQLSVAQFYITRGAYVAAAKRATDIITEYPGAPATADALQILQLSYTKLGMTQEANDTATLIAMNSDTVTWTDAPRFKLVMGAAPTMPSLGKVAPIQEIPVSNKTEVVPVTDNGGAAAAPAPTPAATPAAAQGAGSNAAAAASGTVAGATSANSAPANSQQQQQQPKKKYLFDWLFSSKKKSEPAPASTTPDQPAAPASTPSGNSGGSDTAK
jgi:outer membrane protein assembly factor BamD